MRDRIEIAKVFRKQLPGSLSANRIPSA